MGPVASVLECARAQLTPGYEQPTAWAQAPKHPYSCRMAAIASRGAAVAVHVRRSRLAAWIWLGAMIAVALAVQVLVWGVPKLHSPGGALLPQLRHLCSTGYAIVLMAAELAFCAAFRLAAAAAAVVVTGAGVDLAFWAAHLGGLHFPLGAAAALTSGAPVVVLGAGFLTGQFRPLQHTRAHARSQT